MLDWRIGGSVPVLHTARMDSITVQGANAVITYDGEQIKIKHRGFGWVSAPVHQIVSVELAHPGRLTNGHLRIVVLSDERKGWMPEHPWRVKFTRQRADQFDWLYRDLMARKAVRGG